MQKNNQFAKGVILTALGLLIALIQFRPVMLDSRTGIALFQLSIIYWRMEWIFEEGWSSQGRQIRLGKPGDF